MKANRRLARVLPAVLMLSGLVGTSGIFATASSATPAFAASGLSTAGGAVPAQTGTIALNGTAKSVATTAAGENAAFTFTGAIGQGVSAVLTASTYTGCQAVVLAFVRPDTTQAASVSTCTATAFLDQLTLDQAGTWTVLVDPQGTTTGTATLQAYDATDQTHAVTVSGAPANVILTTPGQNGRYTFAGTTGQEISAQVTLSTLTGCPAFKLSLVRPDGSTLATPLDGCTATAFFDAQTLDQTGTWTVFVDPQGATTGTAKLNAYDATDQLRPITLNGGSVNVNVTQPGQNSTFTFTGAIGQGVSAQITAATFTGCPAYDLYLVRPDGTPFGTVVNSCTDSLFLDAQVLDQNGTWDIVVDPQGTSKGKAQLQAFESADQVLPITLNGAAVGVNLGPGQQGAYTFTGAIGQQVSAQVTNSTFPGCTAYVLFLRRPDNSQLGSGVNGCLATAFLDSLTLDQAGTWAFVIEPLGGVAGSANLQAYTFADQTGAVDMTGKSTKLVFAKPGQNARLTFTGAIGQHVSVYVSQSTMTGCPAFAVSLVRPDASVFTSPVSTCTDSVFIDTQTLDQAGTWTVLVDPQATATGLASIQAYTVLDVTPSLKPKGPFKSFTTTDRGLNAHFRFAGKIGDSRTVTITGSTFGGCPALVVSFVRPDGSVLSSTSTCNANLVLGPSVLDVDGNWTIFVDPQGPAKGTLIIKLT